MKVLIVGGGNMGKTYADSFTEHHAIRKDELFILEHYEEKVNYFKGLGFKNVFHQPDHFVGEADIIILAVKPQDCGILFPMLAPYIHSKQILMSIMAGVKMESILVSFPQISKVIRAMPNLPAQIGMGMTGFTSSAAVSKEELFEIHNLLNTTGKCLYFDKEAKLDAVTAISGSGPAYVFYFMDAMINTAVDMGFSKSQAEVMVEQTFLGAVHLQTRSTFTCQEWITKVASKGGTTEAALRSFSIDNLKKKIADGLHQAHIRAIELGK